MSHYLGFSPLKSDEEMKMRTQKSSFSYSIFVYSLTACATAQSVKFLDAIPGKQFC